MNTSRCKWCNIKNKLYIDYHDKEWGQQNFDDKYLYEIFILEMFQAGLSWECILNKRENFKQAYDNFDIEKVSNYDETKISELINNKDIIRNKGKIKATIKNSIIFKQIVNEFGSFYNYLLKYTNGKIIYETNKTTNRLSNIIFKDLKMRGMTYIGSSVIYSYLQAIGIINSHEKKCFLHYKNTIEKNIKSR